MNNFTSSPSTKQANSFPTSTPASRTLYSNWLSTPLHTTRQSHSSNITQPRHITYSPAPDQQPANQRYVRLILWLTLLDIRYHIAHTWLPVNLPAGYLPTAKRLSTLFIWNLTLPPMMPTHYSHDMHHSLYIPIRRTLHTITQRPQNATTPHFIILYFPSLECYVPCAATICIILSSWWWA